MKNRDKLTITIKVIIELTVYPKIIAGEYNPSLLNIPTNPEGLSKM